MAFFFFLVYEIPGYPRSLTFYRVEPPLLYFIQFEKFREAQIRLNNEKTDELEAIFRRQRVGQRERETDSEQRERQREEKKKNISIFNGT